MAYIGSADLARGLLLAIGAEGSPLGVAGGVV